MIASIVSMAPASGPVKDVVLELENGYKVMSNRALLCEYSTVLKRMLDENTGNMVTIKLPTVKGPLFEVVEDFLRFGKFPAEQSFSFMEYLRILKYSQKFEIEPLRKATMKAMKKMEKKWIQNSNSEYPFGYVDADDTDVVPNSSKKDECSGK